jgi:site-specific DNA-methyltransferase (adenine-specific)
MTIDLDLMTRRFLQDDPRIVFPQRKKVISGDLRKRNRLISRFRKLGSTSLEAGIERGKILIELLAEFPINHIDYLDVLGVWPGTVTKLKTLVTSPYMLRKDWRPPPRWTDCYAVLTLKPESKFLDFCSLFLARQPSKFEYDLTNVTEDHVSGYKEMYWKRLLRRNSKPALLVLTPDKLLNQIVCCDCFELISQLADNSIQAVITSPPYANQRDGFYEGISEEDYPEWFAAFMTALRPKMKVRGSVAIVIKAHLEDGSVSDYVMKTRLAVRALRAIPGSDYPDWFENDELYVKIKDAPPLGANQTRPRHTISNLLWFSKSKQPYIDLTACGELSFRTGGLVGSDRFDGQTIRESKEYKDNLKWGIAHITDVFECAEGEMSHEREFDHPAKYPPSLPRKLIETFSKEGQTVFDPFVGSGTTAYEARELNRNYIGGDNNQEYVDMTNRRLAKRRDTTK